MARDTRRRYTDFFDADDEDIVLLNQYGLNLQSNQLPPGVDADRVLAAIDDYGDSAYFLDEMAIEAICGSKILEKGKKFIAAGQLVARAFDGTFIAGVIADHNRDYHPSFDFDLTQYGCDCSEPGDKLCSHLAGLMWAWSLDHSTFIPAKLSQDEMAALMDTPDGEYLEAITGESDFGRAQALLKALAGPAAGPAGIPVATEQALVPSLPPAAGSTQPDSSTGAAYWPQVTSVRVSTPPINETLEAEFNTAQLRELAKWLGVKLKGTAKSGYIEQVATELHARVARMRATPDVILEGLADEHATFVRRALTARDYELPLPRNLANALWLQQNNKDPDKRLADLIEALRRRALLFPTRMYFGYRDVYYQWLPLSASGGNVPLAIWPRSAVLAKGKPSPALIQTLGMSKDASESKGLSEPKGISVSKDGAQAVNFLDAFDLFINAVLSTGTEVRASLPAHPKTASTIWLKDWEHDAEEAERLLHSRPGWVPNPQSGINVPLLSPLTSEALARLENQTGLPGAYCEFLFAIACALQLVEAPDPLVAGSKLKGAFKPLPAAWRVNARTSAIEEWFALADEDKFLRAWNAWREQVFFAVETRHAAEASLKGANASNFQVMRAIGARDFTPSDLAAEWCALRRYLTRTLRGLPANEWISWPDFRKLLFEFYPDCAWMISSQDHWWFGAPGKPGKLDPTRADDWRRTIGAILEVILCESLHWFGVIEVDAPVDGTGLQTFRLTDVHHWLAQAEPLIGSAEPVSLPKLPASATPRPRMAEPVEWLDDRHWRLPPAPDRAEFIMLARKIAESTDAPFTYALTPASVERALSLGVGLDEVAHQFETFAAPMPGATRTLFKSIADRFGRVRLYESLTVLQLADDYALRELLANTSLSQHLVYQISPRAVVVRAEAVDTLMEEMIARGYTPAVK